MPRVDRESRYVRDALVLRLFLAGWSYRQIGRHPEVKLAHRTVGDVVQRALTVDPGQGVVPEARTLYLLRTEALLKAHMPKALGGDVAAVEVCRKLLEQQARIYGL